MDKDGDKRSSQAEPPPEWTRRRRWPTVVAVLIVLAVIAGIILYERHVGRFKRFEPYKTALALIQKDPKATAELGEPIKDATWIPSGSISKTGDGGEATLQFKVSGPKGKADVRVLARRIEGKWGLSLVELTLPGGKRIDVDATGAGGSLAPKWPPAGGPAGPPGKPGPEPIKQPAPRGSDLKIDIPDLDVK